MVLSRICFKILLTTVTILVFLFFAAVNNFDTKESLNAVHFEPSIPPALTATKPLLDISTKDDHEHNDEISTQNENSQLDSINERVLQGLNTLVPEITSTKIVNGMVPVFYNIQTTQRVVFLTIDDGTVKDPALVEYMKKQRLLATLFLNDSKIADNYSYFQLLRANGNPVENHTVSHLDLTKLNYEQQKKEICDNADRFQTVFGRRPVLFRPPYGAYNNVTRRAAADCGMKALIHWHAKANDGSMQYQEGNKLQAGDIVLMHFRKEVINDITAFNNAAKQEHLQTVLLEDWIN